MLKFT